MIDIADEIASALTEYTNEVTEELENAKEEVAKETVKHLKGLDHPKLTGDYAKGWAKKKVGTAQVIYNRTNYQLTHLLEHGHVNRDGGRTQAIKHIEPAEEKAINDYIERLERVIEG